MDPTLQQNTANGTTPTPPPQIQGDQVIVGGAFGGTVPSIQEAISETMPSFSFDEAEFGGPVQPLPSTQNDLIADPFAGGAQSTTISLDDLGPSGAATAKPVAENKSPSDTVESIASMDVSHTDTVATDLSFDLPSDNTTSASNVVSEPIVDTTSLTTNPSDITDIDFDVPPLTESDNNNNTIQDPVNVEESQTITESEDMTDIDFDIPVAPVAVDAGQIEQEGNIPEQTTSSENTFQKQNDIQQSSVESGMDIVLPTVEVIDESQTEGSVEQSSNNEEALSSSSSPSESQPLEKTTTEEPQSLSLQNSDESNSISAVQEQISEQQSSYDENKGNESELSNSDNTATYETDNTILQNEVSSGEDDDSNNTTIVQEETNEVYANNTHELQENFEEFSTALNNYLEFLGSASVNILGLRTDEDEVNYQFHKEYDNTISIEKSNTGDTITFVPTESGLEILLNNESIAYYGVDKVSNDTTHYLKEKLGKFTMMVSSEHEKQEKAKKDEAKKIKETLRNF